MTLKKCPYPHVFNREEAGDFLGYSLSTMNKKAMENKPRFEKKGKESYYLLTDLEEYEKEQQTF
ncbi:hypothetical protein [Chitinophaga barathri]|uniref:DNA-binding protein n=1 Tax=Chitinophaga barathri TaxID=1647451 RepID=A0A3N4MLY8_9BACT|nr:hypothetical protein [Chitinophaga barathri]RPD40609.1 hypothetical protein EG028_15025 [Chitinophaga barathri]